VFKRIINFSAHRSQQLIIRFRSKLAITAIAVLGLIAFFQTEPAHAGSDSQDGRKYPVDGGYYLEQPAQDDVDQSDERVLFSGLDVPRGAITPNSAAALPDIRVMLLGDSVTKGTGTCSAPDTYLNCIGYRENLWDSMVGGGHPVNLVGSQGSAFQYQYTYDNDHEGHGGFTTTDIKNNVYGSGLNWLQINPADIILLHIGTNDFSGSPPYDPSLVASRVSQILDKVDDYENAEGKVVLVILAKIIKRYDSAERTTAIETFNDAMQTMADLRISGGDNIVVVDMETALIYPGDFFDDLHPNENGYSKMAAIWYAALVDLINFPPTVTNPGFQSSVQDQTISLQIQATDPENDTLTYSAAGLPAGLTINPNSGEISGKISSGIPSGSVYQVTITADDMKGFPYTNPYNKDQAIINWNIGDYKVVLPFVIR
jgi:lysophospholipase L1-like esterase